MNKYKKQYHSAARAINFQDSLKKWAFYLALTALAFMAFTTNAHATVSTIANNMVTSVSLVPGLLTGLAYLLAVILGVKGIIEIKKAVEDPRESYRHGATSLLAGGALFALPIIYEAVRVTIFPGAVAFDLGASISTGLGSLTGMITSFVPNQSFNQILANIVRSVQKVPSLVTAVAYLLGIIFGAAAILKAKAHVDNPNETKLREPVIRFLTAGAMFAIPPVYGAMFTLINGGGAGLFGTLAQVQIAATSAGVSTEVAAGGSLVPGLGCSPLAGTGFLIGFFGGGTTIGNVICNVFRSTLSWTSFVTSIAYLFGVIIGLWGILKIQDHVMNPEQTKIWDGVSRLTVAGGLFALPAVISAAFNTVSRLFAPHFNTGFNDAGAVGGGLDTMLTRLMNDVLGPTTVIIQWFGVAAGFVLIFIGITRLMKSSQEGARGPGGLGTIMTFVIGGALLSFSPMITAVSGSLFANPLTETQGFLLYTAGMTTGPGSEVAHVEAVIAAIVKFVLVLGLISVMRGIYMLREIGEGSNQASMMASVTHIIGGGIAVNLGPMLEAVQRTLGITGLGIGLNFG